VVAIKAKARYEANKEVVAIKAKARYEANKEVFAIKAKARYEANKGEIAIYMKNYNKTPVGKRHVSISSWTRRGAIGDLKTFYNERYLPATNCEVCEKVFKSRRDKCMDHCHDTGEIRWVLCQSCNNKDYWKKVLERKEEATNS
jgi:hypothetical protein